jgi:hypothetical protein
MDASGYLPIELDPAIVPESICCFVADRVEPYLRDVRWMLTAPSSPFGPALNLSIASVLCSVVGGLAVVFHNEIPGDGASFKRTAGHYPLQDEPHGAIKDPDEFGVELYEVFRCSLVHSLGLHMERPGNRASWSIVDVKERYVVARSRTLPLSEQQLAEMDLPSGRPGGLLPTLERIVDTVPKVRLDADALYWGVRRLVRTLAMDQARQAIAVKVLAPWFEAFTTPHRTSMATASTTAPTIVTSSYAMDATLGAATSVSSFWGEAGKENNSEE